MKTVATIAAVAALVMIPTSSFAATYGYVTTQGTLATVQAINATQALASAPNIDSHSGVILLSNNPHAGLMVSAISSTATTTSIFSATSTNSVSTTTMSTY